MKKNIQALLHSDSKPKSVSIQFFVVHFNDQMIEYLWSRLPIFGFWQVVWFGFLLFLSKNFFKDQECKNTRVFFKFFFKLLLYSLFLLSNRKLEGKIEGKIWKKNSSNGRSQTLWVRTVSEAFKNSSDVALETFHKKNDLQTSFLEVFNVVLGFRRSFRDVSQKEWPPDVVFRGVSRSFLWCFWWK